MIHGEIPITSADFNKGLVTRSDFLKGDINASPNTMDISWNFDASLRKRFGSSSMNSLALAPAATGGWIIDTTNSLSTSLNGYWKLDEAVGTRFDSVNNNNLADVNTTGSITGIRGNAALFVALNSNALTVQSISALTGANNFSLSTWVYLNSTSNTIEQNIVSKRDPEIDSATVLLMHMDGANSSNAFFDSGPLGLTIGSSGTPTVDTSVKQIGNASLNLNNTAGLLTINTSSSLAFGTNNFTIDAWIFLPTGFAASEQVIISTYVGTNNSWLFELFNQKLQFAINAGAIVSGNTTISLNAWHHVAVVRNGNTFTIYLDGTSDGTATSTPNLSDNFGATIGNEHQTNHRFYFNGWIDEVRVSNIARWTASFTPPSIPYGVQNFEYWLYVNTNQQATFRVSSTGTNQTATVQASSIGALNTATWYNIIAWHSNNSHIGISANLSVNTTLYTTGVKPGNAPFTLGANSASITSQPTMFMDGRIDEVGYWQKVLNSGERINLYGGGTGNTFVGSTTPYAWGSFDFGASGTRWLTVAAGTGVYASSNLGTTFVSITSSRTQNYQSFTRSKNVLIETADSYDPVLYWAGSAGTFSTTLAPNSAPQAKFAVNYQGFLILLNFMSSNNAIRNRGFAYADENLQLTDPWNNSFDIPSSADDEITASFILYKFLYVSTRFTIFRVAFTGGNPDWSYLKVKDWGFVPRTVQIVSLKGGGQVAIGMDWNRRIRAFDGFDDMFISDNIENDNQICDFAMNKVSYAGSGLVISNAVLNTVRQEYRLNVAIGATSTQTTHGILLNARNLAFYPYSNQFWQTMCMAQSNNQSFLMAADRSGFVYILDSGNLDGSLTINEIYDSPPLFSKLPEAVSQSNQLNLFFAPQSAGTIYYQERFNLSSTWGIQKRLTNKSGQSDMTGQEKLLKLTRTVDVKASYNTYQFRITTSSNTLNNKANPWQLDRLDFMQQGFGIGQG